MWFRLYRQKTVKLPDPDSDALKALERAEIDKTKAIEASIEMHRITGKINQERIKNGFGPAIFDVMRRK